MKQINLTEKGSLILARIYDEFHDDFLENNPGWNANDIERQFLTSVLFSLWKNLPAKK